MAELDPSWMQGGCATAQADRQVIDSLVCGEGVADLSSNSLRVTAGPGALTTRVSSGGAFIQGDSAAGQGMYHVYNDASVTLTHAAGDVSNPRIDLVIAEVRDAQYSGSSNDWRLRIVQGSPAALPSTPALPPSAIPLAQVQVDASESGVIPGANIVDAREPFLYCPDNTPPVSLGAAKRVRTTAQSLVHNASTDLACNSTAFNTNGWSVSTSGIIVPEPGIYQIDVGVAVDTSVSAGFWHISITVNGESVMVPLRASLSTTNPPLILSGGGPLHLSAEDEVNASVFHTTGANRQTYTALPNYQTFVSVVCLSKD